MKNWSRLILVFLGLVKAVVAFGDEPRSAFEQSYIGRQWFLGSPDFNPYPLTDECRYFRSYDLQMNPPEDLGISSFECGGQVMETIIQVTHNNSVAVVLDALLLPKLKPGERYMMAGDCELGGKTDTDFLVIVHLGKREKVNWKTGVRAAWLPNVKTRRFESLSTRHIVCWRPTPP